MIRPAYNPSWPESCKLSYQYDELEIWGKRSDRGYMNQYRIRREWALRSIAATVPVGGSVLDVAGASGNFTIPLAEQGYHVTWNDIRSDLVDYVRSKSECDNVEYSPGNIFDFREKWKGWFDAVLATEIIEHVAHPDDFLVCLAGMLKPGGQLFITTPNGGYFLNKLPRFFECPDPSVFESAQFKPNSDGHIFLLDIHDCQILAATAGLTVEEISVATNPLSRGHVKLGYLLSVLPQSLVLAVDSATRKFPQKLREKVHSQLVIRLRRP